MTASSTPLVGNNIQFKSSLQVKQDAIKAQKEKEQQELLMQQQQQLLMQQQQQQQQDAYSSFTTPPIHYNNNNFGKIPSEEKDEDDPFAGLSGVSMTSPNAKKTTAASSSSRKSNDEDNSDDEQIPLPDDPVLYQAREAALYAQGLLEEQARKKENRGDKALHQLWNSAQGLLLSKAPANDNDDTAKLTSPKAGEIPKPHPHCTRAIPAPSNTPSTTVPFQMAGTHNVPNQPAYANNFPNQASYPNAPAPMVVPVPRPSNANDLDPDGVPWYARTTTNNPPNTVTNQDQDQNVPWYARSSPSGGLNVSVADVEYSGSPGSANDKVPWYSRGASSGDAPSRQVQRSSSPAPSNNKGGIGSGMGATVLGGVVGLVALGPLAGVAAAGGLAYAAAKDGMVGDVVRGAGGLVASAVSAAASAGKQKNTEER